MVKIMMKDFFYLSKLMHDVMYDALDSFTEEQIQKLLNKRGCFKITYEDVEQQIPEKINIPSEPIPELRKEPIPEPIEELTSKTVSKAKPTKKTASPTVEADFDVSVIVKKLSVFESEVEAQQYLDSLKLKKSQLQTLLDHCKLSVPKSATAINMKKRLVDAEVGVRLRSNVIRNTNVGI